MTCCVPTSQLYPLIALPLNLELVQPVKVVKTSSAQDGFVNGITMVGSHFIYVFIKLNSIVCFSSQTPSSPPALQPLHPQHGLLHAPVQPTPQPRGQHLPQTADHPVARWPRAQFPVPDSQTLLQQLRQPAERPPAQPGDHPEEGQPPQGRGREGEGQDQRDGCRGSPEGRPAALRPAVHPDVRPLHANERHVQHQQHPRGEERRRREWFKTG